MEGYRKTIKKELEMCFLVLCVMMKKGESIPFKNVWFHSVSMAPSWPRLVFDIEEKSEN